MVVEHRWVLLASTNVTHQLVHYRNDYPIAVTIPCIQRTACCNMGRGPLRSQDRIKQFDEYLIRSSGSPLRPRLFSPDESVQQHVVLVTVFQTRLFGTCCISMIRIIDNVQSKSMYAQKTHKK